VTSYSVSLLLSFLPPIIDSLHREKRVTHNHKKNTCPLALVADYRFFKHMGRGEESITLNYLVRVPN
jgi:hypothetical protein